MALNQARTLREDEVEGDEGPVLDPYDPGNQEAAKRASQLLDKYLRRGRFQRYAFEREWFKNILYYAGNQWIQWHRDKKQWQAKRGPKWYPKPVTNVYAAKLDDNIASLTQKPPEMTWSPETGDAEDLATAKVAQRIDDLISEETGRDRKARERATWLALTGNVFIEPYYDNSPQHGLSFLEHEECHDCGYIGPPLEFRADEGRCPQCESDRVFPAKQREGAHCPECGHQSPNPDDAFQPCPECTFASQFQQPAQLPGSENVPRETGLDGLQPAAPGQAPMGPAPEQPAEPPLMQPLRSTKPAGEQVPRGKMCSNTLSPFEVFFDHQHAKEFTEEGGVRWVCKVDMIDKDEAESVYGFRPEIASESSASSQSETSLSTLYLQSLAVLTDGQMDDGRGSAGLASVRTTGLQDSRSSAIVRETLYMLPETEGGSTSGSKFTEGLYAVRLNGTAGKVVECKPLPYHDNDDKPFINIIHIPFKKVPGRVWGKTVGSDIIPLQDQRNMTEAEMMMNERRMSNGTWLIPENSLVRMPTGEPGEQLRYIPMNPGTGSTTVKPERLAGIAPSNYFKDRMESLDQQIERISGSFGVAHGEAPKGITAASALALLGERQQRQISPQIQAWELGHEALAKMEMFIFREYAADTRIHAVMGQNSDWKIEKWSSADLSGRVNVRVKAGSAMPKSSAQSRAQVEALTRMQALRVDIPEQNRRILEEFGEDDMNSDYTADTADAQKEEDRFMMAYRGDDGGQMPMFRPLFDNHEVHIQSHTRLGKTDEYREMERMAQEGDMHAQRFTATWEEHMMEHINTLAASAPPPAAPGADGKKQQGPGRPGDSGAVLSRGARAPGEEATRTVTEPRMAVSS